MHSSVRCAIADILNRSAYIDSPCLHASPRLVQHCWYSRRENTLAPPAQRLECYSERNKSESSWRTTTLRTLRRYLIFLLGKVAEVPNRIHAFCSGVFTTFANKRTRSEEISLTTNKFSLCEENIELRFVNTRRLQKPRRKI